jgi:hypothetical protein
MKKLNFLQLIKEQKQKEDRRHQTENRTFSWNEMILRRVYTLLFL